MRIPTKLPISVIGEEFHSFLQKSQKYINLDNAATTPVAQCVFEAIQEILPIYGSIHRGSGLKSVISTELYEGTFNVIRNFLNADNNVLIVISSNTTTAINRFAQCYGFKRGDMVVISEVEHSSNDLPWRKHSTVMRCRSTPDGTIDLDDLKLCLERHGRNVRLVSVTGASNVTGYLPPIKEIARIVHEFSDAELFVDAAQLVAHRQICMSPTSSGEHPDYIAFSGHKMYAPFGIGIVAGRSQGFEQIPPDLPGGGTIDLVTEDNEIWSDIPARLTPGTPNLIGLIAITIAMKMIKHIGYETIKKHESKLVQTGLNTLQSIPGVRLHGQGVFSEGDDRLPIFPFTVEGLPHGLVAAILGHEYGIAVRQGHLCQHEFMRRELNVSKTQRDCIMDDIRHGDKTSLYGMVRASAGICTSEKDLNALGETLQMVLKHGPKLNYCQDRSTGEFIPTDHLDNTSLSSYLSKEFKFLFNM